MASVSNELERAQATLERYGNQLEDLDAALVRIEEENQQDNAIHQSVQEYEAAVMSNPADLAAEDALDSIIHLQNQLKIARRRNQLLAKENTLQQKTLHDRSKALVRTTTELQQICDATGWHEDAADMDMEKVAECKEGTHEILVLESEVQSELKAAKTIIRKKEEAIVKLSAKITATKDREAHLNKLYNDIRVRQRDSRELQAKIDRMSAEDKKVDHALGQLQVTNNTAANSVACIESDKDFLQEAVSELKLAVRRQSNVVKAQMARQAQLQKRLDTVMKSLREMKLEKEFERNVSKSALVPSASREEPQDVSEILPEDECIPIDTYRLLYKNNEMMRTNVARKNMLVLEKESVIQAVEHKLLNYINSHNQTVRQDDNLRLTKTTQIGSLMGELNEKHQSYRAQIDVLVAENSELRQTFSNKMRKANSTAVRNGH